MTGLLVLLVIVLSVLWFIASFAVGFRLSDRCKSGALGLTLYMLTVLVGGFGGAFAIIYLGLRLIY